MSRIISFQMDSLDYLQIIEAVRSKAEAWNYTARWLRAEQNGSFLEEETRIIEECSDPDEAERVALSYESILSQLETQYRAH